MEAGRPQVEVSEFASWEAQAFDGKDCPQWEYPRGCVVSAIKRKQWDLLDKLLERDYSDNVKDGVVDNWNIRCAACGMDAAFDVMETSDTKFDVDGGGYTTSSRSTLSKSGAKRRRIEAKEELDRIAHAFNMDIRAVMEAHRLFELFHEHGSSSGGRGHKTTVVAALHRASKNAAAPIPISVLCKAHSENPTTKVVSRFLRQAREKGLVEDSPPNALQIVNMLLARMNSNDATIEDKAREYCSEPLSNVPPLMQAAASIYLAADAIESRTQSGSRKRKYSGVNIAKHSFVDRRQIYRYASRMQHLIGLLEPSRISMRGGLQNLKTQHESDKKTMTSSDIRLLRNIRKS